MPSKASGFSTFWLSDWLIGRNAWISPPRLTSYPPLTILLIVPDTGALSLNDCETSFHIRFASALVLETSGPLRPNFFTKNTCTLSPTFGRSPANSATGSLPSDLQPTSRKTYSSVTWITIPSIICPSSGLLKLFRDSSNCVWKLPLEFWVSSFSTSISSIVKPFLWIWFNIISQTLSMVKREVSMYTASGALFSAPSALFLSISSRFLIASFISSRVILLTPWSKRRCAWTSSDASR